jgi:phenylalanyl-tRNA synthetase beta chain
LTLLNGQTATLTEETLIIADSKNPLAIAGVMGGLSSAVTEDTRTIFVESAYFSARLIRGKSRLYGLHTESSYRFERGIDEKMTSTAIDRVTELLVSLGHAVIGEKSIYCNAPYFTQRQKSLSLSSQKLNKVLGYAIALKKAKAILLQLGCELMTETAEIIEIMPPSHRHDLLNPEDLIHEIVRIDGYDKIPESPLLIEAAMPVLDPRAKAIREIKHFFASLGYAETVTYAFNEGKLTNEKTAIRLKNPLTRHLSVMRDNLIESLLMAQSYNEARQMQDIRLFEMGRVYSHSSSSQRKIGKANFNNGFAVGLEHSERWHVSAIPLGSSGPMDPRLRGGDGEIHQPLYIAGLWVGQALPTQWEASSTGVDFYTIKGHLESYFESQGNMNITYRPSEHSLFHPTQSADIFYKDHLIGVVGRLHPKLVAEYKLKNPPYLFEVQLEALLENKPIIYAPISPYPMVSRDLAFVMDENFSYEALEKAVRSVDVDCQLQIDLFDIYRGDKILHHQKSLAIRLQFSSLTKTLTEDMINGWVGQIINAVETQCGAILRGA